MIYLAADHAGLALKEKVKTWLTEFGAEFTDLGPTEFDPADDYPLAARPVAERVSRGEGEGILICDTGEGMAIAANKFPQVRATLVTSDLTAARSREHNGSNILVLGAELQGDEAAKRFLQIWLSTPFSDEERHRRRLGEIKDSEHA